jgi:hypothetical protein
VVDLDRLPPMWRKRLVGPDQENNIVVPAGVTAHVYYSDIAQWSTRFPSNQPIQLDSRAHTCVVLFSSGYCEILRKRNYATFSDWLDAPCRDCNSYVVALHGNGRINPSAAAYDVLQPYENTSIVAWTTVSEYNDFLHCMRLDSPPQHEA